jgi:hypothetical protein
MTQTNYTRDLADIICDRMTEGESLRAICRNVDMPSEGAVRGWAVRDVDGFGDRYRAARLLLMDFWADQIVDSADDGTLDPRDRQIRTSVRQWIMSKISRCYGERLVHSGDPESPVRVVHQQLLLTDLTGEQLEALDRFTALIVDQQVVKPGS